MELSEEDEEALTLIRAIIQMVQRQPITPPNPAAANQALALAAELVPLIPELLPGVAMTGMFVLRT